MALQRHAEFSGKVGVPADTLNGLQMTSECFEIERQPALSAPGKGRRVECSR